MISPIKAFKYIMSIFEISGAFSLYIYIYNILYFIFLNPHHRGKIDTATQTLIIP